MTTLSLLSVLPETIVLAAACAILVLDVFLPNRLRHWSFWLTQATLVAAMLACAWILKAALEGGPIRAMNGLVIDDMLSDLFRFFTCVAVSLTLFYARGYFADRGLFRGETFVLALTTLLGMLVMISAANFLTLYMGLELQSLSLYAMVAMHRSSRRASEAAMKYFVLGALASGMLLYGMSMVYGATGSLDLNRVGEAVLSGQGNRVILVFGLVFIVSAIAFKLGAVPYHMWVPDVYDGAPTAVTLLLGTAPKLAAFAFMLRLLVVALGGLEFDWQGMLMVLSLLSMILGNVIAIAQTNIKRMLAYSTIANMGFMLMGFLTANLNGYSAAMFYAVAYVLTSLVSFGMVMLLSREGFEADRLTDFRGLNQRSPWWAFVMLLTMFSLAGIPPTVGFYAKFTVIQAAVSGGFTWLAVVAVLASLVGAFYYLRIVKLMYFDDATDTAPIIARGDNRALLSANGLALLFFGMFPQQLMGWCATALTQSGFL
ncbi:MAG TPA: NADH-quinone oxidoreductase subunit NuoN [Casimicrobiaceae bacterium]